MHVLKDLGFTENSLKWFESYLFSRKQMVYANNAYSDINSLTHGVPQGSVLGPLLFLIYLDDFPSCCDYFSFRMFADDTSLTIAGTNIDNLIREINNHVNYIFQWLCTNKLTLNVDKTKYLIFQPRQKVTSNLHKPVLINDTPIASCYSLKYLGFHIDNTLTWADHIDYLEEKLSKNINILIKCKRYLSQKCLLNLYYALIYPYLSYGCMIWGNNYRSPQSPLIRLQNKFIRVICDVPWLERITPYYAQLSILKPPDIVKLHTCLHMFDLINGTKNNFDFDLISDCHNYSTRSSSQLNFYVEPFRINMRKFSPSVIGKYYWNDLPLEIKSICTRDEFKKTLVSYYLNQY